MRKGKTAVLTVEEASQLLDSMATDSVIGLRDRALIGTMAGKLEIAQQMANHESAHI